jgi:hypothetical protein
MDRITPLMKKAWTLTVFIGFWLAAGVAAAVQFDLVSVRDTDLLRLLALGIIIPAPFIAAATWAVALAAVRHGNQTDEPGVVHVGISANAVVWFVVLAIARGFDWSFMTFLWVMAGLIGGPCLALFISFWKSHIKLNHPPIQKPTDC